MKKPAAPRYLTKSRFKLAVECPSKLFYTGKTAQYPNAKQEDEFLKALAAGGFQVGELAKLMFPGGIEVTAKSLEQQVEETRQHLARDQVTIFEGSIRHDNLFVRVDILEKSGASVELIEVKAKSFDSTKAEPFRGARRGISSEWLPYLQDIAFQRHVLDLAYPNIQVKCFLMLADKSTTCSVDGLNQRFKIRRQNGRPIVSVAPGTNASTLGTPVLTKVNVDSMVDEILREPIAFPGGSGQLADLAQEWAEKYRGDTRIAPNIGSQCAKCEFHTQDLNAGMRSGLQECWLQAANFTAADFAQGSVLDLWNFRGKQALIDKRILKLVEVPQDALNYQEAKDGLSNSQRQWMQVSKKWPGRPDFFFDSALIKQEMATWTFPLHFIDFETSRVAIPFFAGQPPYSNIAFQFSHHVVDASGQVEHKTEFLCTAPGVNPNLQFVRALKAAIGSSGTVFMWWPHENTTLNGILEDLERDPAPPADADELKSFIRSVTKPKKGDNSRPTGDRAMVDLCRLASQAFFHPATKGSNSLKKVLPAVMQSSDYLKTRYSKPIYGSESGIKSKNFQDQVWWQELNGDIVDPYKMLPPVFTDLPAELLAAIESDEELEIAEGGAATTAYSRLQFEDLQDTERTSINSALLRYCELDTLAMVLIYEAWREWQRS